MLLLLHNKNQKLLQELSELAASNDHRTKYYFAHIDRLDLFNIKKLALKRLFLGLIHCLLMVF